MAERPLDPIGIKRGGGATMDDMMAAVEDAEDFADAAAASAAQIEVFGAAQLAMAAGGNAFLTKAELDAAIPTILNTQWAIVYVDETRSGVIAVYRKEAGAAVWKRDIV